MTSDKDKDLLERLAPAAARLRRAAGPLSGAAVLAFLAANLIMLKGEFSYDYWSALLPLPLAAAALLALPLLPCVYLAAAFWEHAALRRHGHHGGARRRTLVAMGASIPCLAYIAYILLASDHAAGRFQTASEALRTPLFAAAYMAGPLAVVYALKTVLYRWLDHSQLRRLGGALAIKAAAMAAATVVALSALLPLYFYFGIDIKAAELGGGIVVIK